MSNVNSGTNAVPAGTPHESGGIFSPLEVQATDVTPAAAAAAIRQDIAPGRQQVVDFSDLTVRFSNFLEQGPVFNPILIEMKAPSFIFSQEKVISTLQNPNAPHCTASSAAPFAPRTGEVVCHEKQEAIAFLEKVRTAFSSAPNKYNLFVRIMSASRGRKIDENFIIRVCILFQHNTELVPAFNAFISPAYKIKTVQNGKHTGEFIVGYEDTHGCLLPLI